MSDAANKPASAGAAKARTVRCPACGGPSRYAPDNTYRPFCSERCQMLDLAHWLDGDYRVEGPADGAMPDMEPDDPEATDL